MSFSTKEKAIIPDEPIKGQICIDEELLLPKTNAAPSESEQLCKAKCSEYTFSEPEDEKSDDTKAKVILVSKEQGAFEDEGSENVFEEFDLDEYKFIPPEEIEICIDCTECELFENCYPLRKSRKRR